jgi:hypothetical protein
LKAARTKNFGSLFKAKWKSVLPDQISTKLLSQF